MTGIHQMLTSGVKTPASVTFIAHTINNTSVTTYTFSSASLGAADASRHIAVTIHARNGASDLTISSVTINGVAGTQKIYIQEGSSQRWSAGIWSADVPTGTTGDIVVTWSGAPSWCSIGVFRLLNLTSATPTATASFAGDVATVSLNISANGVLVACETNQTPGAITTVGVTENYDTGPTSGQVAGGSATELSVETPRTVTFDGAGSNAASVSATWN